MAWSSLFLPSDDGEAIIRALRASLAQLGYSAFDPFGLVPGPAYKQAVRLFVAPPDGGWTRVIGDADPRQHAPLSAVAPVLAVALEGQEARIGVYADGQETGLSALAPFLRPGCSLEMLERAQSLAVVPGTPDDEEAPSDFPLDALPEDIRALSGKINMQRAQAMFARLTGTAARRAGQDDRAADEARQLLAAGSGPRWESAGGQRIRMLMRCLTVPEGWQWPDFVSLRDAYQLHARRRRNPNADLYPGDTEAMARVPNALEYTPIYGGANS